MARVTLVTAVLAKIRDLHPEATLRYPDSEIREFTQAVDSLVCERVGHVISSTDISLVDGALWYTLPESCVEIKRVAYSRDGVNFDDGELIPVTMPQLDNMCPGWLEASAQSPTMYSRLSAAGSPAFGGLGGLGYSRLLLWPAIFSADGQAVRVFYSACPLSSTDLTLLSKTVTQWEVDKIYVPGVLAMMAADESMERFGDLLAEMAEGLDEAAEKFQGRYRARTHGVDSEPL